MGTTSKENLIEASQHILEMIQYIKAHPSGYDQDDMLWLIKTWTKVGMHYGHGGNPIKSNAHYAGYMNRYFLGDFEVTADTRLTHGFRDPADDAAMNLDKKPSRNLYLRLNDLMNQVYSDNDIQRDSFFDWTEEALGFMLMAYRL